MGGGGKHRLPLGRAEGAYPFSTPPPLFDTPTRRALGEGNFQGPHYRQIRTPQYMVVAIRTTQKGGLDLVVEVGAGTVRC